MIVTTTSPGSEPVELDTTSPVTDRLDEEQTDGVRQQSSAKRLPAFARAPHRWWLAGVLTLNATLGLLDLTRMGLQNTFYAAGAWSASQNWHAFFFAGLDPAGGASIDKPPLALWVEGLSVRVLGLDSWGLLLPQVVMGVACSGLLHLTVRRLAGPSAGVLAAAVMTLTPVAVWMFKSDEPDPLMVLLLVTAAYCLVRALDRGNVWWMVGSGSAVGFAFEAKMLEATLILPGLVLAFLFCGGSSLGRRIIGLVAAAAAMVVTGLWWMVIVQLTPAGARPYISSTDTNSVFDLAFGYNGAARLGVSNASLSTSDRLFTGSMGPLISFLLPAALLAVPVLLLGPRGGRRSPVRAGGVLFGGWLLAGGVTLTYSTGLINVYYVLVIAPAVAGLVGIAGSSLWRHRHRPSAIVPLTLIVVATSVWGALSAEPAHSTRAWLFLSAAAVALALTTRALGTGHHDRVAGNGTTVGGATVVSRLAAASLVAALLLPTAVAAFGQVGTVHEPPMLFAGQRRLLVLLKDDRSAAAFTAAVTGGRQAAELELQTGRAVLDIGGYHGSDSQPTLSVLENLVLHHRIHYYIGWIVRPPSPLHRVLHPAGGRPRSPRPSAVGVARRTGHTGPNVSTVGKIGSTARSSAARSHVTTTGSSTPKIHVTTTGRSAGGVTGNRRPPVHSKAQATPDLAAQFGNWVAARYRIVLTDGSDQVYDLWLPLPPAHARAATHVHAPARVHAPHMQPPAHRHQPAQTLATAQTHAATQTHAAV